MTLTTPDALFAEYLRRGDPDRFADLYDLVRDELTGVARRLAPDQATAEDLVQATFLGALESAQRFRRGSRVMPWLIGILQNQARVMRWRQGRSPDAQRLHWPEPRDPVEVAADREFATALANALDQLGPTYAPVMELHLGSELSAIDIGARLERPAGTVRTQVVRGTAMLRRLLPVGVATMLLVRLTPGLDASAVRVELLQHAARGQVARWTWFSAKALWTAAAALVASTLAWMALSDASKTDRTATPFVARQDADPGESHPATPSLATSTSEPEPRPTRIPATPSSTATLTVAAASGGEPLLRVPVLLVGVADPRFTRSVALTDATGKVSFPGLAPGQWAVMPLGHRQPMTAAFLDLAAASQVEHRVEIDEPLAFEARVVDERGAPLAGADVWLCDGDFQQSSGFGARRVVVTDANGTFALTAGGQNPLSHVQATAPGRRASTLHPLPRQRGEQHTFVLAPDGGGVAGVVTGERGEPVAGVLVRAAHAGARVTVSFTSSDGTDLTPPDTIGAVREVVTGDDGRFRLDGFDRGRPVALTAWGPDWARFDDTVVAGDGGDVAVTLRRGATIHGLVTDQGGRPVKDATVTAGSNEGNDEMASRVRTNSDGRYTLAGVTPGDAVSVAIASRPNWQGLAGAGEAAATLQLEGGRTHEWNAVLHPGASFRGTLTKSDGTAFDGWTIELVAIDEVDGVNHFPVLLGKDGGFAVENVPRSRYLLQFDHGNCMLLQYFVEWPFANRSDIVVPAHIAQRTIERCNQARLEPRESVAGTIDLHVDGSNRFDLGTYVFAVGDDGRRRWLGNGLDWNAQRSCWTTTLAPGSYEVTLFSTLWSRDALATADQVLPFTVTTNRTTTLRHVLQPGVRRTFRVVEPSPHFGADSGIAEVHDANGKLVSQWILGRSHQPPPGTFEASVALAPGRYRIAIETDFGHRGALDFTVEAMVPFAEVVELPVR